MEAKDIQIDSVPVRPKIQHLFESGIVNLRSAKYRRTAGAMAWRQKYLHKEVYELDLNDSRTLRLRQIQNGSLSVYKVIINK